MMGEQKNKCGGKVDDSKYEDEDECNSGKEDVGKDDQQGKKKTNTPQGLAVQAYDRDGRVYKQGRRGGGLPQQPTNTTSST
jgi:hypothetical protein